MPSGGPATNYPYIPVRFTPRIGLPVQPDTIIPNPREAIAWDRYAFGNNNPINFTHPSEYWAGVALGAFIGTSVSCEMYVYNNFQNGFTGSETFLSNMRIIS